MFKSKRLTAAFICLLGLSAAIAWAAFTLQSPVEVVYDVHRVPTIRADSEAAAMYSLGYIHARDRFFQMDYQRRLFSGTLAELVGPAGLASDAQLRTLGLRRAAERSLAVQTPEVIEWLEAYADGVNAFLDSTVWGTNIGFCANGNWGGGTSGESAENSFPDNAMLQLDPRDLGIGADEGHDVPELLLNALPPEYAALELDRNGIPDWTPVDSLTMVKGLAFGLSFDLDDIDRTIALVTIATVTEILGGPPFNIGINPLGLFNADLYPSQPFDPTISIPSLAVGIAPDTDIETGQDAANETLEGDSGYADLTGTSTSTSMPLLPHHLQDPELLERLQSYRDTAAEVPLLLKALESDYTGQGSNWFILSGDHTESGFPMIANDPHLALGTPATFYEAHIAVEDGINVTGATFPGAPGVVVGCTDVICWGATVNPLDVTDVFQEVLLDLDLNLSPDHIFRAGGAPEPLDFIPQTYNFNLVGDGGLNTLFDQATFPGAPPFLPPGPYLPPETAVTLIVPRRNNGPIVQVDAAPSGVTFGTAFSVQYTGFAATRELEAFRLMARAESPDDFKDALQFFDVGSQNWAYADVNGNIAYFTSAELPLRTDLQILGFPIGEAAPNPPYIVRDGTGTLPHDWLPLSSPEPHQALDFPLPSGGSCCQILPFSEMPQIVNPPEGVILNANNDPIGTTLDGVPWDEWRLGIPGAGRLYLSPGYAPGFRIGRIQQLFDEALADGGKVSLEQFVDFQGNNQLLDAQVFVPYILEAFDNASVSDTPALAALAAETRIIEAVSRLAAWDFSTPTGIPEGFDPDDESDDEADDLPTQAEIDASVAATIYSTFRGQLVTRVIDQTLNSLPIPLGGVAPDSSLSMVAVRRLLDNYSMSGGTGQSLINFFNEPDAGAGFYDPRDLVLLRALGNALDLLASPTFAPAFGDSTNQEDYRWGKLHRIVFEHPLGGPFNIPPPGSPANVSPDLAGFARAGGLGAVDASAHSARAGLGADPLNEFMFGSGPSRRFIGTMKPDGPKALEVLPGGESGVPGSPYQTDQLDLWLINEYHPLPVSDEDVDEEADTCQTFVPPPASPLGLPPGRDDLSRIGGQEILEEGDGQTPRAEPRRLPKRTTNRRER